MLQKLSMEVHQVKVIPLPVGYRIKTTDFLDCPDNILRRVWSSFEGVEYTEKMREVSIFIYREMSTDVILRGAVL